jgi:sterol desaturase/sphingolipid hydroxylase (fatty acid hydroxylase superfamily)
MTRANKSRVFRRLYIAGAVLLSMALIFALRMGFSYGGKCGGFLPEVSAQRPCSLWAYMTGDVVAIAAVLAITYWPVVLMLIILAVLTGYYFGRRARHDDAL